MFEQKLELTSSTETMKYRSISILHSKSCSVSGLSDASIINQTWIQAGDNLTIDFDNKYVVVENNGFFVTELPTAFAPNICRLCNNGFLRDSDGRLQFDGLYDYYVWNVDRYILTSKNCKYWGAYDADLGLTNYESLKEFDTFSDGGVYNKLNAALDTLVPYVTADGLFEDKRPPFCVMVHSLGVEKIVIPRETIKPVVVNLHTELDNEFITSSTEPYKLEYLGGKEKVGILSWPNVVDPNIAHFVLSEHPTKYITFNNTSRQSRNPAANDIFEVVTTTVHGSLVDWINLRIYAALYRLHIYTKLQGTYNAIKINGFFKFLNINGSDFGNYMSCLRPDTPFFVDAYDANLPKSKFVPNTEVTRFYGEKTPVLFCNSTGYGGGVRLDVDLEFSDNLRMTLLRRFQRNYKPRKIVSYYTYYQDPAADPPISTYPPIDLFNYGLFDSLSSVLYGIADTPTELQLITPSGCFIPNCCFKFTQMNPVTWYTNQIIASEFYLQEGQIVTIKIVDEFGREIPLCDSDNGNIQTAKLTIVISTQST